MTEQQILHFVQITALVVIALIIVIECRPKRAREKAQTDAQMAYIEAEREVNKLKVENEQLREELEFEKTENCWAREFLNRMAVHCGTKDCPSLVAYVGKLRDLCNDMWSVMSCEYASDAMADACHDVLDCDMDEVERRVNELCKEES